MAKKNYTEEEKKIALAKAAEIGVRKAAAELSIPWQTLAVWVRKEKSAAPAAAKTETAEKTDKKEAAPKKRGRKPVQTRGHRADEQGARSAPGTDHRDELPAL